MRAIDLENESSTLGVKQIVVSKCVQGISLVPRVTAGSMSEDFEITMKLCPIKRPQLEVESTPTPVPIIPTITPGP